MFYFCQGGDICRFNFKPKLPIGVQSGFAEYENLETVELDRFKDSLIGERTPRTYIVLFTFPLFYFKMQLGIHADAMQP